MNARTLDEHKARQQEILDLLEEEIAAVRERAELELSGPLNPTTRQPEATVLSREMGLARRELIHAFEQARRLS